MAAAHFNWTQLIPGVEGNMIVPATASIVTVGLIGFSYMAYRALKKDDNPEVPASKFSIKFIAESLTEFIISLTKMVIGDHGVKYTPLFGVIFIYILINNLVGLLPGMTPATDNLNTTLAVGLFSFAVYNSFGIKEHGVVNYLKHFAGPLIWLAPLMIPIELVSHAVRPMSLGLRLMGNMTGDHTVLGIFLDLTPWLVPVAFYFLGLFVCFVQAFVFTLLSMVYVSMAVAHDH